jgi:hypothetical protein
MLQAIQYKNYDGVEQAINRNANVRYDNDLPLKLAIQSNQIATVRLLIKHGANGAITDKMIMSRPMRQTIAEAMEREGKAMPVAESYRYLE